MLITWLDVRTGSGAVAQGPGFITKAKDIDIFEAQFFEQDNFFVCGFDDMTIVDILAFFAIIPFHKSWLDENQASRTFAWAEKLQESEEICNILDDLKVDQIVNKQI